MMENKTLSLIKQIYPLLGETNYGQLAPIMHRLTWVEMSGGPYGGIYHGIEEINAKVFTPLALEWSDFHFEANDYLACGPYIIVVGQYNGTHLISQKTLLASTIHLWKIIDQQTIHFEQFTDTALFYQAMEK